MCTMMMPATRLAQTTPRTAVRSGDDAVRKFLLDAAFVLHATRKIKREILAELPKPHEAEPVAVKDCVVAV
jgi:hypothetical protein